MPGSGSVSMTKGLAVDTRLISNAAKSMDVLAKAFSQAGDKETAEILERQAADLELASPELQNCWGGPFNGQKSRQALFHDLVHILNPAAVIETGTFRGITTEWLAENYSGPVLTCEKEALYYLQAKARLCHLPNVGLHLQDSRLFLSEIILTFPQKVLLLFYLDAHWECDLPLKEELQTIFASHRNAVVVIDDFRVPDDSGYGWDDYGPGKSLDIALLDGLIPADWKVYFPSAHSVGETGAVRGCCVIASDTVPRVANSEYLRGGTFEHWTKVVPPAPVPDELPARTLARADVADAEVKELRANLQASEADHTARLQAIERLNADAQQLRARLAISEAARAMLEARLRALTSSSSANDSLRCI
jgi:predicted O-methyltransferase YrrM